MIDRLQATARALRGRLKLKPREQGMMALLGGALGLYAAIWTHDQAVLAGERAASAADARATVERRSRIQGTDRYYQTAAREARLVKQWSLSEPTIFIARVRAETEIETIARKAGLANVRASADRAADPRPPVDAIAVSVEGDFDWAGFARLLAALEAAVPAAAPTAVTIDPPPASDALFALDGEVPASRFRLTVRMPYLLASRT